MGQVAQLVEHATENRGVDGSIPSLAIGKSRSVAQFGRAPVSKTGGWGFDSLRACTESCPHRLTVRTPLFQGGDRGSIPREGMRPGFVPRPYAGWGCSSVWLECRSVTPEAAGSSPVSPAGRLFENLGRGTSFSWRSAACSPLAGGKLPRTACSRSHCWGRSSVGRAPEWHSGGQGFDSPRLHCGSAGRQAGTSLGWRNW